MRCDCALLVAGPLWLAWLPHNSKRAVNADGMSCCPALTVWCVPPPPHHHHTLLPKCPRLAPLRTHLLGPCLVRLRDTAAPVGAHKLQLLLHASSHSTAAVWERSRTSGCWRTIAAALPLSCIESACKHTNNTALCVLVKQNSAPTHAHPLPAAPAAAKIVKAGSNCNTHWEHNLRKALWAVPLQVCKLRSAAHTCSGACQLPLSPALRLHCLLLGGVGCAGAPARHCCCNDGKVSETAAESCA